MDRVVGAIVREGRREMFAFYAVAGSIPARPAIERSHPPLWFYSRFPSAGLAMVQKTTENSGDFNPRAQKS